MAADRGPGAGPWVPTHASVQQLREAAQRCQGCELFRDATQAVMGAGPENAALMLVGEQPGDQEDREGLPFVGPAGRLLVGALGEAGLDPATVYRTNAVKHFRSERGAGKRIHKSPSRWHLAACEPWLLAELDLVRPEVVVLLGATAGQAVYGSSFRVGTQRGRPLDWPEGLGSAGVRAALATVHPSSVLRSRQRDADHARFVADLVVAREVLGT